jgi:hypothetical protein
VGFSYVDLIAVTGGMFTSVLIPIPTTDFYYTYPGYKMIESLDIIRHIPPLRALKLQLPIAQVPEGIRRVVLDVKVLAADRFDVFCLLCQSAFLSLL